MNESTQLSLLVIVTGLMIYGFLRLMEYAARELSRRGKVRVVWLDPDGGDTRIEFHERTNGNEILVGKGERAKRFILQGAARLPGRYATYLLHPRHGWNFLPLTDAETIERDALLQRLAIADPAIYHNATARNKARDALRANDDSDKGSWIVPVAICAMVALLAILGMVAWIAVKISEGAMAPAGGA